MNKKYVVRLSDDEREELKSLVKKLKGSSQKVRRAQLILKADAEFVACMEEVLDTYEEPYDREFPVVCMDEQPVQLHKETRQPIPATRHHSRRVDYEYERCGKASVSMFTEPLAGWHEVTVRSRRTKLEWALEMAKLLTARYKQAKEIILVCDNLNTHTKGASTRPSHPKRRGVWFATSTWKTKRRELYTPVRLALGVDFPPLRANFDGSVQQSNEGATVSPPIRQVCNTLPNPGGVRAP